MKRNIVLVRFPYLFTPDVSGRPSPLPSAQASARPSAPVISPPSPHRSTAPDARNVAAAWPLLTQLRPAARHARFTIPRLFPSQPTKARNFNGLRLLSRGRPSFASKRLARSAQLRAARLLLGSLRARRALHPRRSLCSRHRTLSGARVSVTGPCLRLGHQGSAGGPGLPGALRIAAFLFFLSACPPLVASLRCASAPASRGRTHLCRLIKREWFPLRQCVLLCVSAAFAGLRPSGADLVSLSRGAYLRSTRRARKAAPLVALVRRGTAAAAHSLSAAPLRSRRPSPSPLAGEPPFASHGRCPRALRQASSRRSAYRRLLFRVGGSVRRSGPLRRRWPVRPRSVRCGSGSRQQKSGPGSGPPFCQYSRMGLFASCAIRSV